MISPRTLVDLFAGGGFFSWGFVNPRRGGPKWELLLAVDIDKTAVATLSKNFTAAKTSCSDLAFEDPKLWREKLQVDRGRLGLLHASPPCTDFSMVNRRGAKRADKTFNHIFKWVEEWLPLSVCIENVPSFRNANGGAFHKEVLDELSRLGYSVADFVLQAADYGVPQWRRRLFYVAYRTDSGATPTLPLTTHGCTVPYVSSGEAIASLPKRIQGQGDDWALVDRSTNKYDQLMISRERSNGHSARSLNETQMKRLGLLRPGDTWNSLPKELQPEAGFRHCYGRIDPAQPSFTITTGVGGPSRGCFSHYEQDRVITFREAARLQSISDDYELVGGRGERARLIGNGVPPLLAEGIRLELERALRLELGPPVENRTNDGLHQLVAS